MEYIIPNPMGVLFIVMLIAGLLGGAINHFLSKENIKETNEEDNNKLKSKNFIGCDLLIGLGASFTVPLFLNMISSDLISVIVHGSKEGKSEPENIYVFAGFCLIAAISSRAFIRTLSDRILREAKEAKLEAKAADEKVQQIQKTINPILDKETESDTEAISSKDQLPAISENAGQLLRTLAYGKFTLRSLSGLSSETEIPKEEVHKHINDLISSGLVAQMEREGRGPRWYITTDGRKIVRSIKQGNQTDTE